MKTNIISYFFTPLEHNTILEAKIIVHTSSTIVYLLTGNYKSWKEKCLSPLVSSKMLSFWYQSENCTNDDWDFVLLSPNVR